MSFFVAERKEPSFERERKKERERKREKRKISSVSRVLGLGYRKSRSEARWREEVMPGGASGEVMLTLSRQEQCEEAVTDFPDL